ncbi:unnamed protein product [Didymodactylos carnosus]|uniref:FAM65 N-terminal domain-containing protein n=1 Tax=Didymodactylos carnosus TaxID=1234261 RepID=A0A8S2ESJ4_9BILA|nr:unnamed protein product [Didymodactylos carnosus]CAF4100532.1 unnamed protein product [Didymodactylos carnosus]
MSTTNDNYCLTSSSSSSSSTTTTPSGLLRSESRHLTASSSHGIPDVLGNEQIDLNRLKKTASLNHTNIPKTPRIHRTLSTLDSVLNVLEEHGRTSKIEIDNLVEEVEKGQHHLTRKLHESQTQYLKLQAHTASIQSLKECYCRYVKLLDGARTMFNAYQNSKKPISLVSTTSQVKLGLKECTQTLCAIEAQLESMLGTFVLKLNEITGFSRICVGDEYEIILRYGQQKHKTRGKIQRDKTQTWSKNLFSLKAKLADLLFIKVSEIKLLGTLHTVGIKCFEVNNLYSINQQRMVVNANQAATIKLQFVVFWDMYHQVDTKFTYYNPNRSYSDVTRTWSMFIGNSTLLRTVNDTLSNRPVPSSLFSSPSSSPSLLIAKRVSSFWPVENDLFQMELKQRLQTQNETTKLPVYAECSNEESLSADAEAVYDEIDSLAKKQHDNTHMQLEETIEKKADDLQCSPDVPTTTTIISNSNKSTLEENKQSEEFVDMRISIIPSENDENHQLRSEEAINNKIPALLIEEPSTPTNVEEDKNNINTQEDEEAIEHNTESDFHDEIHDRSRSLSLGIDSLDGDNSVYELEMLIQQIKTCLDDIRLENEQIVFDQLDENMCDLDSTIKHSIHEQTERNLEIEDVMESFEFLNEISEEVEEQQYQTNITEHEEESKQQAIGVTIDDGAISDHSDFGQKTIDSGFVESSRPYTPASAISATTTNESINVVIVELLGIVLKLLYYIQNRLNILRDSENLTVIKKLLEQIAQLKVALLWCKNEVRDVKQALTLSKCLHIDEIIDFWNLCILDHSNNFYSSYDRCISQLTNYIKEFDCVKSSYPDDDQSSLTALSEHILSNLCCLPYIFIRPKHVSLLQILFLFNDKQMFEQNLKLSIEQVNFAKNIVNMIANNDYKNLAMMLNRNTLNNIQLIDQIITEMNYKIPDEFINELSTEIRLELINQLKSLLNKSGPSVRLAIHKTILRVQQACID